MERVPKNSSMKLQIPSHFGAFLSLHHKKKSSLRLQLPLERFNSTGTQSDYNPHCHTT